MIARLAIALLVFGAFAAQAQQATTPEPIVRTAIDPQRVMVGQPAILQVEVLAPNYMPSPPVMPAFQLRNAVTRQLQSVNANEQQNGVQYAGVRFEFAIYPLEEGSYAVDDQKLTIKYAAEPPATREAVVSLPHIEFQAFVPAAGTGLHPFLTASSLTAEQTIQRSGEQLKVGDAVTRAITIRAQGTPAMLLPPVAFPAIDGLAVYPAQPSLEDKTVGRSDALSSVRIDSATYMLERPGDYVLPAIDVRWWNAGEARIATAHLGAVPLQVAATPAAASSAASNPRWNWDDIPDFIIDHWLVALMAATALALIGWFAPRLVRAIARRRLQRREAWLRSESFSFARLRQAAGRGDARGAYFALLDWLARFEPVSSSHTVASFRTAAADPALDHEIDALQATLFAPGRPSADWSPRRLLRHVRRARRALSGRATRLAQAHALPRRINPASEAVLTRNRWRVPAR